MKLGLNIKRNKRKVGYGITGGGVTKLGQGIKANGRGGGEEE